MTQPGFQPLSTVYTRALRLLGLVPAQRQLQTPLTVQPVQVIADVSDVSIPHSNPVFGASIGIAQVALEHSALELTATSRLLKVRIITMAGYTDPRIFVQTTAYLTTVVSSNFQVSLGPGADVSTAQLDRGTSTTAPTGGEFAPQQAQFDLRPPLLIAKGSRIVFADRTVNTAPTLAGVIWEEIPDQDDIANLGFPTVGET